MRHTLILLPFILLHTTTFAVSDGRTPLSFGIYTNQGKTGGGSNDVLTATLWFDYTVYRCPLHPTKYPVRYQCDESKWARFDASCALSEPQYKMMLNMGSSTDAVAVDYLHLSVADTQGTVSNYTISKWCVSDSAAGSCSWCDNPDMGDVYVAEPGDVCGAGSSQYDLLCVDNQADDCGPERQMLTFDMSVADTQDSQWTDASNYPDITTLLTCNPTAGPTGEPTSNPTVYPTIDPTIDPTLDPTSDPTFDPTMSPTVDPTSDPTNDPTFDPTMSPTLDPTRDPTLDPTSDPTIDPPIDPTLEPTTDPTFDPTSDPTTDPTKDPSADPTLDPTSDPTRDPSADPTSAPSSAPTSPPTNAPSNAPSNSPTACVDYDSAYNSTDGTDSFDTHLQRQVSLDLNATSNTYITDEQQNNFFYDATIRCDKTDDEACFVGCYSPISCDSVHIGLEINSQVETLQIVCRGRKACQSANISAMSAALETVHVVCGDSFSCLDSTLSIYARLTLSSSAALPTRAKAYQSTSVERTGMTQMPRSRRMSRVSATTHAMIWL